MSTKSEIAAHMPRSLQIMMEIEEKAQIEYQAIMADIRAGKTDLEKVKRKRGLL